MNAFPGVWVFSCSVLIPSTLTSWRYFGWGQGSRYKNNRSRMKLPKLPMTQITQISLGSFILTIILSALSRMDRFYIPWYQVLLFIIQVPWISKGENDCFLMSFYKLEVTGNLIPMPTLKDSSTKNHLRKHISPFQTIYHSLPTSRCLFVTGGEFKAVLWSLRALHFMVINLRT